MKVSTILTRRRFSVWWEYARQWMFRTLVTKKDLKDEIGEVAKEISVQNVHKVIANKREFVPSAEIKDGAVIFHFLTFKQMEKIRILGEDVYITFRLAYDNDEEEITLLTTSDSTLPNEWIDAVGFAYENNVKDSISVEVGTDIASKIDTIEIDGLFGNLLTEDATWRLADTRKAIGEIDAVIASQLNGVSKESTSQEILREVSGIKGSIGTPTLTIPDTTAEQELAPNVVYIFANRTSELTLTLGAEVIGKANEYHFFIECGETAPTITFPSGVEWNGGNVPTIAANKTYEVSILNNIAAYFEV